MKHIILFENYESKKMSDREILDRLSDLSGEKWYLEGEDPPLEVMDELGDVQSDDPEIQALLDISTLGPGHTDVWISRNELISAIDLEEEGITEDDIYEDNKREIAKLRKNELPNLLWKKVQFSNMK